MCILSLMQSRPSCCHELLTNVSGYGKALFGTSWLTFTWEAFSDKVRSGSFVGYTGKKLTDVLCIGLSISFGWFIILARKVGPHHQTEKNRTLDETEESEVPTWALNLFMKRFETWMKKFFSCFFPIVKGMMYCHALPAGRDSTT